MNSFIIPFSKITITNLPKVGGKNASLGEMIQRLSPYGIQVPDGFAVTVDAYHEFISFNCCAPQLNDILNRLDPVSLDNLSEVGSACRKLISEDVMPEPVQEAIARAYKEMEKKYGDKISVAVRSSATAEDLPTASFAGQHDSFLNISGIENILKAVQQCYVSLFNDRAIKYRIDNGFSHMTVYLSVGVQLMVRSDKACAGVAFTIEPENGNENLIYITGAWGLGESVVQGAVNTDEFYLFKPGLEKKLHPIVYRTLGNKQQMMIYAEHNSKSTQYMDTPSHLRDRYILLDEEIELLGQWCLAIEKHYNMPMDIEWAKDGNNNQLYIVQARPETIHRQKKLSFKEYSLHSTAKPLCTGKAVGRAIVSGRVSIVRSLADAGKVQKGDIIVAEITNPDWNALLRKAICIVTNKGGRTSHASIVARELGIPAVVGTLIATDALVDEQIITVSCVEGDTGYVYDGQLTWEEKTILIDSIPVTRTQPMFILADPEKASYLATLPNQGVGLLRMEFIIANSLQIHPMALVKFNELPNSPEKKQIEALTRHYTDKKMFFTEKLAESLALVASAFYPKDVIVRMSDFKTNEYAQLLGGKFFEPKEENPMLGFRGASRYYNERYREGFGLECAAIVRARDDMGLTNIKVMIPFCRTVQEGQKVLDVMKTFGLEQGRKGLEVYVMTEIPSNVILADQFAQLFDGFSIGSNDLTQLTLGLDRDSEIVSDLFNESNEAVTEMISQAIRAAKKAGIKIGLCGQAPSDNPGFSKFLVNEGIDSISFTPDALIRGIENIAEAEKES
jgi:pyruvate, water dikinase